MIAQASGVYIGRLKVVTQRVHRQQRRVTGLISEVVFELSTCQFRATLGLGSNKFRVLMAAIEHMPHKGEGYSTEVTATPEAGNYLVWVFTGHLHLPFCLQAYDGLVQRNVVQHRP